MRTLRAVANEIVNPVSRPTFWALVSSVVAIAWPGHAVPQQVQDVIVAVAGLVAMVDVGGRYALHATKSTPPVPAASTSPPTPAAAGGQ